jgi:hypothetical protein
MYKPSISVVSRYTATLSQKRTDLAQCIVGSFNSLVPKFTKFRVLGARQPRHGPDGCQWLVLEKPHFQRHAFNATHVTREIGRIGTIHREFAFLGLADGAGDSFSASESAVP